jgi:hypothetical protein
MAAPLTGHDLGAAQSGAGLHDDGKRRGPPVLRGVRAAFAFFTRLPVGGFPYDDRELAWAPAHAPLVGAVLGAALGALDLALLPLGGFAAAALVVGIAMLLTGALHEDGLADTSDALGGGRDPSSVFAILERQPRRIVRRCSPRGFDFGTGGAPRSARSRLHLGASFGLVRGAGRPRLAHGRPPLRDAGAGREE